jgi:energy-coupling factor transporter ATP-binding protein EcfA2
VPEVRGSLWHRWDPHIHTPGTVLENNFPADSWGEYLTRIERSEPRIRALGVTDYWSIDRYVELVDHKETRLADVELVFPNVEIRFAIGTGHGSAVNAHLLVSPDDPNHVQEARRFLASLTFRAHGEAFSCTNDDLMKLGRVHVGESGGDRAALEAGTNQFKVTVDGLKQAFDASEWARRNILVAVAAGSKDGTSGLQEDASLTTVRREIETMADIVFSARPKDRAFWLGDGSLTAKQLEQRYGGAKPCLHGSDAHTLDRVAVPEAERYTWIKGDLTFESLRQVCIEPGTRAFIGPAPPTTALPHQTIDFVEVQNAPWCQPSRIALNPGLVGIIGARGSGKTALADLIASAGLSRESELNDRSFLRRAAPHLAGASVRLVWVDGETTTWPATSPLLGPEARVQYLSQQFVERLCAAEGGIADELLREIERVVYDAHPPDERVGAANFEELLDRRAGRARQARANARAASAAAISRLAEERAKVDALPGLRLELEAAKKSVAEDKKSRDELLVTGSAGRNKRLEQISAEIEKRQLSLDAIERERQTLLSLRDYVADFQSREAPRLLAELRDRHAVATLSEDEWRLFELQFTGDVRPLLDEKIEAAAARARVARGEGAALDHVKTDALYVADDADLSQEPLTALRNEAARLRELAGLDARKLARLKSLDEKIQKAEIALSQLERQVADAVAARARIDIVKDERREAYAAVFDGFRLEEQQLGELYAPLAKSLESEEGALGSLAFSVRRKVDVARWAEQGEALFDLRTSGAFKGAGTLFEIATQRLAPAWRSGSGKDVAQAMTDFREEFDEEILKHAPAAERTPPSRYSAWGAKVAAWLDSVDHVSLSYSVEYGGVPIESLSPGTRGIVLLLLYLSVDQRDDRPLIIDQPEENLDPQSIYEELVDRFRTAAARRQVIIVTHNANLIVNTDADQVIAAEAGPHRPDELPEITYSGGALENETTRDLVCSILEGGETAFKQRARRLRVGLHTTRR